MTALPYTSVELPSRLSVSEFERAIYPKLSPRGRKPIVLDLRGCTWIEPTVLLYLQAVIAPRIAAGSPTRIQLPRDSSVLDFMRAWHFPEAFQAATTIPLSAVADDAPDGFFGSSATAPNRYAGRIVDTPFGADRLLSRYFFEIQTFRAQPDLFGLPFALNEAAKWHRMGSVLRHVLRGPAHYFASRIVYEALLNAIRHPGAGVIQLISHLQKISAGGHAFSITFWDDGMPIASTLRGAAARGRSIRPSSTISLTTTYRVSHQDGFSGDTTSSLVTSDDIPTKDGADEEFLLASLFPGTTSNVHGYADESSALGDERDGMLAQPGMGLYLLVNAAVAVYGGEVTVRSGRHRIRVQPLDRPDHYAVSLRSYKNWPPFNGNLITVRLPLRERTA